MIQLSIMKVRSDIKEFISTIPNNISLVAATKYVDANEMRKLFNAGVNNFGENRADAHAPRAEHHTHDASVW